MAIFLKKYVLLLLILLQLGIGSLRLTDVFADGSFHMNWGPPFWLLKAQSMEQLPAYYAFAGVAEAPTTTPSGDLRPSGYYSSHPQFISIPLGLWTRVFGTREWAVRSLAELFTTLAMVFLFLAVRRRQGTALAAFTALTWILLPIIFTYGRKLDQEIFVTFFLALGFYAYERFVTTSARWPVLWTVSMIGLVWSDWSGWLFAGLCAALFLTTYKRERIKPLFWATIVGGAVGAIIVVVQLLWQSGWDWGLFKSLYELYGYRSETSISGKAWNVREFQFFMQNYTYVFSFVGVIGGLIALWYARIADKKKKAAPSLLFFFGIAFLGTLIYAFVVKQASYIHIYFQYYYSFLVASGIVYVGFWIAKYRLRSHVLFVALVLYIVGAVGNLVYAGQRNLYEDVRNPVAFARSDIKLIEHFAQVSVGKNAVYVFAEEVKHLLDYPNVNYYTKRKIPVITTPAFVHDVDWALIPAPATSVALVFFAKQSVPGTSYTVFECSKKFCVLKKN